MTAPDDVRARFERRYSEDDVRACAKRMKFYDHQIAASILNEYADKLAAHLTRSAQECVHDWAVGYGVPAYCNHCGVERDPKPAQAVDAAAMAVQNLIDREHHKGRRATAHEIREVLHAHLTQTAQAVDVVAWRVIACSEIADCLNEDERDVLYFDKRDVPTGEEAEGFVIRPLVYGDGGSHG